ncbi:hypothetical protein LTR87_016571 [Friedmanniomyces endolithicus]|nr:hypothetical protein LTR87_016571 [Friedmanniomyces endolithicus]
MDDYTKELVGRRMEKGYDRSADWFLCKNPPALRRVQDEVRSTFHTDGEITPRSVNSLPYMLAVLWESLRIFPPTAFGIPRIISTKDGQKVAGNYLRYGTRVAIFHIAAYHSEANFARPEEFIPERWLSDTPNEYKNDRRDVLQPFMVGPRNCIENKYMILPSAALHLLTRRSLAYAEMRLLLAKMLWHFDFELADPSHDWYGGLRAFMVWERSGLRIRLRPVQR